MKHEIILEDGKILVEKDLNGYVPYISIKRLYTENDFLKKMLMFSMWDDFEFNAFSKEKISKLEFCFDENDPFYNCLNCLLDKDHDIVIDDDSTFQCWKKYILLQRVESKIRILFVGDYDCEFNSQKFKIFVKNIGPDARSKLQDDNLKLKLIDFFTNSLYHLMEEKLETNKVLKKENL